MPSGARRAGAAKVMAARIGRDPSFLVTDPIKAQLLAAGLGSIAGTLTHSEGNGARTAVVAALPLLLTQFLRRREMRKIQEAYDSEKRMRLRELDTSELFGGWGGSARLGAVSAYETMRKRKYQDIGALSEAGDALALAAGPLHLPITNALDHWSASDMLKKAEFSEQRNSPVIPMYLLAALGSAAGAGGASAWAHATHRDSPKIAPQDWHDVVRPIAKGSPVIVDGGDMRGAAFFTIPRDEMQAAMLLNHLQDSGIVDDQPRHMRDFYNKRPVLERKALLRRLQQYGAIKADSNSNAGTIAHEAGHARIEQTPGLLRFLQRNVYPHSAVIAPLAGAGSMAAGLASGGTLRGALLGTGIGLLGGVGTVAPEIGASYHGLKGLESIDQGALSGGQKHPLAAALSTYLAAYVLPSTLAGAAGGYISGRRKKMEDQEKTASMDANKLREIIRVARKIGQSLGPDARDRYTMEQAGSVFRALTKRLQNQRHAPTVAPVSTPAPSTPPVTVNPAIFDPSEPRQMLMNFDKRAAAGVIARMQEAKAHSDAKRYNRKHRILRELMDSDPEAFVVDSDDGKGIVGITHTRTGFRFHMPKQKLPRNLQA